MSEVPAERVPSPPSRSGHALPAGAWRGTRRGFAALVGGTGMASALTGRSHALEGKAASSRHAERPFSDGTLFDDGRGWVR